MIRSFPRGVYSKKADEVMSLSQILQLLSLCFVLITDTCDGAVPQCFSNWFGLPCRYKCHCAFGGTCNKTTGECTEPSTCEKGWFGPSCQYVDLVTTNLSSTPVWVYDFPDMLCNPGEETVLISLTDEFYFTWLRLRTNVTVSSQSLKCILMSSSGSSVECSAQSISRVSDKIMDIHCQAGVFFQQLTITGEGVKYLCSVQISGGRNIALGQSTSQTSVFHYNGLNLDSWLAVDGNTDPNWVHLSCTNTDMGDKAPSWTLFFDRPHHINRYLLYSGDESRERLQGSILEAYQENTSVAFTYTDPGVTIHDIYRIQSTTPQIPVSRVTITAAHVSLYGKYLTLCEVEMFGDTVCPVGRHGRYCENRCNCVKYGESCFVSTGGCPSGCAAGYYGEGCQLPCSATFYGENCALSCSPNCTDQLCSDKDGICQSCVPGRSGLNCGEACPPTTFGQDCRETCSTNCSSQLCDSVTGKCASCVNETAGDFCNQTLPTNEPDESPPVGAIVGPVVAVVVLVALIVGGVFIWRKHKHIKNEHLHTSTQRFQNVAENECVETGKSNSVTKKQLQAVTGQVEPSVMRKSIDGQDNKEIHPHNVDRGYYNFVPKLSEDPEVLSDQDISTGENQQQFNNVSATVAPGSSNDEKNNCPTNSGDYILCEIPTPSSAVIQESQQLNSADGLVSSNDNTPNIYDTIDDTAHNTYEDISNT